MTTRLHRQRGITLVEALVGLLILSLGLLGALRLQSWLRLNGELARQRTEAVRLAQQDMEQVRGFADADAFSEIANQRDTSHPAFALARTVTAQAALKSSQVSVSWQDRGGTAQTIQLHTHIAGVAPIYSAALSLPPQDRALAPRRLLPPGARRLTAGRSVFKPSEHSGVAWILDTATGEAIAQCSVPPGLATRDITEAHLGSCSDRVGVLIRGYIRFSLGPQPDASQPNDAPLALTLSPASCEIDTVRGAERYVAYVCFVPQGSLGSEPLRIVPDGWAFGATASTYKACRYAAAPLNYLVIRGDASCPAAVPQHNQASVATLPYQP
jgi:Tfp pilus assembly protein PilV